MRSIAGMLILLFTTLQITELQAQRARHGTLKGTVIDSATKQPIETATVSVFLVSDSSLINYDLTDKKGEFLIRDIPQEKRCRLLVSFNSFSSWPQEFTITSETKVLLLKPIYLRNSYTELEEVIITARRPPILIKHDTLEFDAGSFRTAPNSVVEDLLKQLPGVEVDGEGNITVNGKKVTKITVNGRDFFGTDFKITTKNLPRDIIDKIQIVDFKTQFEQLAKNKSTSEDKVINLVFKKDINQGFFGRGAAAYGSQKRYESGANLHYFKKTLQLSIIGYANNINLSGFGTTIGGGTGNGILESKAGGLNFNNEFGNNLNINGSYLFKNNNQINGITTRRQNILPDTAYFYDAVIHSTDDRNDHRLNIKLEYKLDSATTMNMNVEHFHSNATTVTFNKAASSSLQENPINAASNLFFSRSKDNNTNLELFMTRRLNEKGRAIAVNLTFSNNNRYSSDANKGTTIFHRSGGIVTQDSLDQQARSTGGFTRFNITATYNEPITSRLNLELRYGFTRSRGNEVKETQSFNSLTGQYDLDDSLFSNSVRTGHHTHFPFVSLGYMEAKFNISIGTGVQWIWQFNNIEQTKFNLVQNYSSALPFANIAYRYSQRGTIYLTYTGRSQQPTIDQLQTAPDNRNTLYIRLGNPSLKATFFHQLNLSWLQSDAKSLWNARLSVVTAKNNIIYETWFDSVQVSRPVNTNGNNNLTGNVSYSRNWRKMKWSLRLSLTSNGHFYKNVSFANKIRNLSRSYGLSQTIALSGNYNQKITVNPSFSVRYNNTRNSFQSLRPTAILTHTIMLGTTINWPQRFIWENNIQRIYNNPTAPGFRKGITIWNMALNHQFFKQQQGTLRFSVFDLLKQSTSINRSITPTYIEDTQIQALQQYFLISFIYNLKRFGK